MEHMNKTKESEVSYKNRSETRFKILLLLLRMIGIQINVKKIARVNVAKKVAFLLCFYTTVLSLYMDTFVHRNQLTEFMKKLRLLIGMHLVVWMHFSLR